MPLPAACVAGTYAANVTDANDCASCQKGFECPGGAAQPKACRPGSTAPREGMGECTVCDGGSWQNETGAVSCKTCLAGSYCPEAASAALTCEAGRYSQLTNLTQPSECQQALPGFFAVTGSLQQTRCSPQERSPTRRGREAAPSATLEPFRVHAARRFVEAAPWGTTVPLVPARRCLVAPARSMIRPAWAPNRPVLLVLSGIIACSRPRTRLLAHLGSVARWVRTIFGRAYRCDRALFQVMCSHSCRRRWRPPRVLNSAPRALPGSTKTVSTERLVSLAGRGTGARALRRSPARRIPTTRCGKRPRRRIAHAARSAQLQGVGVLGRASTSAPAPRASTSHPRATRRAGKSSALRGAARAPWAPLVALAPFPWRRCRSTGATTGSLVILSTCGDAPT